MALIIEKQGLTSATMRVSYWRVGEYTVRPGEAVNVTMRGYWTEEDRRAGVYPADQRNLVLDAPEGDVTLGWIYEQAKIHPDFAGAESDIPAEVEANV